MIHKEGFSTLLVALTVLGIINISLYTFLPSVLPFGLIISSALYLFLISFFRNPNRVVPKFDSKILYAPADGKVVVIEEVFEDEYLKSKVLQVSIFMSPLNVHVNRNPIDAEVEYYKYHPGKYLAAWEPKASTENERTTTVYKTPHGLILMRQIAGALARRIVCYLQKGQSVKQGEDMGFIKFGSRVDLYLPLGTAVNVKIGDIVLGNKTIIAKF